MTGEAVHRYVGIHADLHIYAILKMGEQPAPPTLPPLAVHTHSQAAPTAVVRISLFPPRSFARNLNPVPCASLTTIIESKSRHYFHRKTVRSVAQPASEKPLYRLHCHIPVLLPPSCFLFSASCPYSILSRLPRIAKLRLSVSWSSHSAQSKIISLAPSPTHPVSKLDICS